MKQIESACLIDDDHIFIFAAKKILLATDICQNFTIYNNGADAIEGLSEIIKTGKNVPDLILLDINMPNMNGIEATQQIRELESKKQSTTPIVAVTANALVEDKKRFLEAGMDDYLAKPIVHTELHRVLSKYLVK